MKQNSFIKGLVNVSLFCAVLGVFALAFFYPISAAADTGNTINTASSSVYNSRWGQYLGTHLTGTITDIEVKVGKPAQAGGTTRGVVVVKLCEWDTEADALNNNDCTGANELVNGQWTNTTNDMVLNEAVYSSGDFPVSMDPAKFYTLYVSGSSNGGLTIWGSGDSTAWRSQVENVNPGGAGSTNNSATGYTPISPPNTSLNQGTDSAVRDIYFVLVGTAQTNASVTMYFPGLSTASTTPDGIPLFNKFGVSLNEFNVNGTAQVHWANSTTTLLYGSSPVVSQVGNLASTTWISLGGVGISPGRHYANAQYFYGTQQLTSDIIAFDIATSSLAVHPIFPGSECTLSTSGCAGAYTNLPPLGANCVENGDGTQTCTSEGNPTPGGCFPEVECFGDNILSTSNLSCALNNTGRAMGRLFFCPLPALQNEVSSTFAGFKEVFPANIFFGLNDTLESAVSSTPGSASLSTSVWGHSFNVLSSSTLSSVVGETWKTNIFNTITSFAWVIVGGIVYFTIK